MCPNIIHELKKFLNSPQEITLELTFSDFKSSIFEGIRVLKELTTNKNYLTVVLIKNKAMGSVSFFFRDSPTYQFELTVENIYLFNDNNSKECIVQNFIFSGKESIVGTQIRIEENSLAIYASINDGKPRGLDSLSFYQLYSNCSSVKNYSHSLEIENLSNPNYKESKINNPNFTSNSNNNFSRITIILVVIFSISLISISLRKCQKTDVNPYEFDTDTVSLDSSAIDLDTSEFWIQKQYQNFSFSVPESMNMDENLSNENQRVFIDNDTNIGITISHSLLPEGHENETISSLINGNTYQFALSVNENNKKNFSDFKLLDYDFDTLGNAESFLVTHSSTEVSGKNISMIVKSYFVISSPNYYSIVLSYPENSVSKEDVIKRIIDSFIFNISDINEKISPENSLEFLNSTNGNYPKDINLLEDSTLKQRLIKLIGIRYYFLVENWNVENPIVVKNNFFVAFGCQSQNCDSTNFIIIIDFSKDILYAGIRENNNVESYSEDGSNTQILTNFISGDY